MTPSIHVGGDRRWKNRARPASPNGCRHDNLLLPRSARLLFGWEKDAQLLPHNALNAVQPRLREPALKPEPNVWSPLNILISLRPLSVHEHLFLQYTKIKICNA